VSRCLGRLKSPEISRSRQEIEFFNRIGRERLPGFRRSSVACARRTVTSAGRMPSVGTASIPTATPDMRQPDSRLRRVIVIMPSDVRPRPHRHCLTALLAVDKRPFTGPTRLPRSLLQRRHVWNLSITRPVRHVPWNKGKLVGQKAPLKQREIWAIRIRLQLQRDARELAPFNLAIDSKLRSCDLVRLRVRDVCQGGRVASRAS